MCVYLYAIMYMTLVFCTNNRKWYSEQIAVFLVIIFFEEENSRPMESSNFELHFPKHWSPFEFPFSPNGGILKSPCLFRLYFLAFPYQTCYHPRFVIWTIFSCVSGKTGSEKLSTWISVSWDSGSSLYKVMIDRSETLFLKPVPNNSINCSLLNNALVRVLEETELI